MGREAASSCKRIEKFTCQGVGLCPNYPLSLYCMGREQKRQDIILTGAPCQCMCGDLGHLVEKVGVEILFERLL